METRATDNEPPDPSTSRAGVTTMTMGDGDRDSIFVESAFAHLQAQISDPDFLSSIPPKSLQQIPPSNSSALSSSPFLAHASRPISGAPPRTPRKKAKEVLFAVDIPLTRKYSRKQKVTRLPRPGSEIESGPNRDRDQTERSPVIVLDDSTDESDEECIIIESSRSSARRRRLALRLLSSSPSASPTPEPQRERPSPSLETQRERQRQDPGSEPERIPTLPTELPPTPVPAETSTSTPLIPPPPYSSSPEAGRHSPLPPPPPTPPQPPADVELGKGKRKRKMRKIMGMEDGLDVDGMEGVSGHGDEDGAGDASGAVAVREEIDYDYIPEKSEAILKPPESPRTKKVTLVLKPVSPSAPKLAPATPASRPVTPHATTKTSSPKSTPTEAKKTQKLSSSKTKKSSPRSERQGSTCHNCRRKSQRSKMICPDCLKLFCINCYQNKYAFRPPFSDDDGFRFRDGQSLNNCPACLLVCDCSFCRKRAEKGRSVRREGREGVMRTAYDRDESFAGTSQSQSQSQSQSLSRFLFQSPSRTPKQSKVSRTSGGSGLGSGLKGGSKVSFRARLPDGTTGRIWGHFVRDQVQEGNDVDRCESGQEGGKMGSVVPFGWGGLGADVDLDLDLDFDVDVDREREVFGDEGEDRDEDAGVVHGGGRYEGPRIDFGTNLLFPSRGDEEGGRSNGPFSEIVEGLQGTVLSTRPIMKMEMDMDMDMDTDGSDISSTIPSLCKSNPLTPSSSCTAIRTPPSTATAPTTAIDVAELLQPWDPSPPDPASPPPSIPSSSSLSLGGRYVTTTCSHITTTGAFWTTEGNNNATTRSANPMSDQVDPLVAAGCPPSGFGLNVVNGSISDEVGTEVEFGRSPFRFNPGPSMGIGDLGLGIGVGAGPGAAGATLGRQVTVELESGGGSGSGGSSFGDQRWDLGL